MTDFGKRIKIALVEKEKKQSWLIEKVKEATGLYFDSSYLCKVMNGKNNNPKIIGVITQILELDR